MFRKVSESAARRRGPQGQFQSASLMLTPWNQRLRAARPGPRRSQLEKMRPPSYRDGTGVMTRGRGSNSVAVLCPRALSFLKSCPYHPCLLNGYR